MYFSTKTPVSIDNKTIAVNYQSGTSWISKVLAIPAFDALDSRFSNAIDEKFKVSLPINVGMYQNRLAVSSTTYIPHNVNCSRKCALAYVSLVPTVYEFSSFYACEYELLQETYQLNKWWARFKRGRKSDADYGIWTMRHFGKGKWMKCWQVGQKQTILQWQATQSFFFHSLIVSA